MTDLVKIDSKIIEALDNASTAGQLALTEPNAFKRTFDLANSVSNLRGLLTPQVLRPIKELAGTSIGFKTDKMYNDDIIRDCLIQGCINGVFPVGNMFNILADNFYITKEGYKYKLDNLDGLKYSLIAELPNIKGEPTYDPQKRKLIPVSAVQGIKVKWTYKGEEEEVNLQFPIKYYGKAGEFEALVGKAQRKAMNWLWNTLTGGCLSDAEPTEFIQEKNVTDTGDNSILINTRSSLPAKDQVQDIEAVPQTAPTLQQVIEASPIAMSELLTELKDRGTIGKMVDEKEFLGSEKFSFVRDSIREQNGFWKSIVNAILDRQDHAEII